MKWDACLTLLLPWACTVYSWALRVERRMDDHLSINDLEVELLSLIGEGAGSVARLNRLCRGIKRNCQGVPAHVQELASFPIDTHMERALHSWVSRQPWRSVFPPLFEFDLPITLDGIYEVKGRHACLLPHEVFGSVYKHKELFEYLFTGPPGNLVNFWNASRDTDWCRRHVVRQVWEDPEHAVPFGNYGDDAGLFLTQKFLVILFGSVAVQHVALDNRIVFTAFQYLHAVKDKSLRVLYRVFTWSCTWWSIGEYPPMDHDGRYFSAHYYPERMRLAGTKIAGDFVGAWSEMRADWKYMVESLVLDANYATNRVCHLCRAHKRISRLLYTMYAMNSHLRRTCYTHQQFMAWQMAKGASASELIRIPGFHIYRCWADGAHELDLGWYQFAGASCLVELVQEGVWHGLYEDRYLEAHLDYKEYCQDHNLEPGPRFRYKNFVKDNQYPCMTMHMMKGAQMLGFMRWLLTVLERPGVSNTMHGQMRKALFANICFYEDIFATSDRFIPRQQLRRAQRAAEAALLCYNALSVEAQMFNRKMWHTIPKNHLITHLMYDQAPQANPRRVLCYADEEMVGKMKRIMERCHGSTAGRMGMHRYIILAGVRWWLKLGQLRGIG